MKDTFDKQYNTSAKLFTELYDNLGAHISTDHFQRTVLEKVIPKTKEKKLIDFGCGPGTDFGFYINSGFDCSGLDISSGMVEVAKKKYPNLDIRNESFSKATSFKEKSFDLVVSKYAIQTIADIDLAYEEVSRLLIKNGYFAFLVVHPIRAFLEKKISSLLFLMGK